MVKSLQAITICKIIGALVADLMKFEAETSASLNLWTSGSHSRNIICQAIFLVSGVTVTIHHLNIPDAAVVQWQGVVRTDTDKVIN